MKLSVYINGVLKEIPIKNFVYNDDKQQYSFITKFLFSHIKIMIRKNELDRIKKLTEVL